MQQATSFAAVMDA
jgi:hypothetical protein